MRRLSATTPREVAPGKWQFTINLPPSAERRYPKTQRTKTFVDAKGRPLGRREGRKRADAWRAEVLAEMEQHACTDPGRLTFGEMASRWLAAVVVGTPDSEPIQPVTADFYRINLDRHILPTFGARLAAEITRADLTAVFAKKRESLSETSVKHIRTTIRAAYSWALDEGLQDRNPVVTARRRRGRRSERKDAKREYTTWSMADIAAAVRLAEGQLVSLPTMLGGWCGLRRGEVCGLWWEDVDLDAGNVTITRALEQVGGTVHVSPPKSDAGYRTVPMPEPLVDALRRHHALYSGLRLSRGPEWNPEGYVLSTDKGTPIKPRNLSSAWSDFCRRKQLEHVRFHDLRHSYATDLIFVQHESINLVAELLGHSDPAITASIYLHTDDKMHKRAGMRQNKRVTAALAKAEQDSRLVRDNVKPLREAVG